MTKETGLSRASDRHYLFSMWACATYRNNDTQQTGLHTTWWTKSRWVNNDTF